MKNFTISLLLGTIIATPTLAAEHGKEGDMMGQRAPQGNGMMMENPSRDRMMDMQKHMQDMHSMMGDIRQEQDKDRQRDMLHQHMNAMQQGMKMMGGPGASQDSGPHNTMTMEERMEMMQSRMNMMQGMMGQMMDHMQMMEQHRGD